MYRASLKMSFMACCLVLNACVEIPDLGRAHIALSEGNIDAARKDLSALAERNIPEAQLALAELALNSNDPRELDQSIRWFRQAASKNIRANRQLAKLLIKLQPQGNRSLLEAEKLLRSALRAGDQEAILPLVDLYLFNEHLWPHADPVALIKQGKQQNAPFAYLAEINLFRVRGQYITQLDQIEKNCKSILEKMPACWKELLEVNLVRNDQTKQNELIALATKKLQQKTLDPLVMDQMANVLATSRYAEPQPKAAKAVWELISPVYPAAYTKLARLYLKHPYLGNTTDLQNVLELAIQSNQMEAHLIYGKLLFDGKVLAADPKKAEILLSKASPFFPKAEYLLGKMYQEGLLGEADPHKAMYFLLNAARRGRPEADLALTSLYSERKGVKPNLEYAWMFSSLAAEAGNSGAIELHTTLDKKLTAKISRQNAMKYKDREKNYRLSTHRTLINQQSVSKTTR